MREVLTIVSGGLLLVGCMASAAPSGSTNARSFRVGAFDAVNLRGSDDVRVVRGSTRSVVASGPSDVLDRLDIHVEGTTLKVGRKRGWLTGWNSGARGAIVTVTTPLLNRAEVSGSGDMTVDRTSGSHFDASVAGSGDLTIGALSADRARFELGGSGTMRIAGRARQLVVSIAGSGNVDAVRLVADRAELSVAGSGDATVTARQHAAISLVGSGDVTVRGTRNCAINKIGSGDVRCTG